MIFASADYAVFLVAVFALAALVLEVHGARSALAWVAALLLGDLIFLLVAKNLPSLWDPVGTLVFGMLARNAPRAHGVVRFALGTGAFALGAVAGARGGAWLASDRGQSVLAAASALVLASLGLALAVAARTHRIDALSAHLSVYVHITWLVALGVTLGTTRSPEARAASLPRLLVLFLASMMFYHAWAAQMPGAYRYLLGLIVAIVTQDYYFALWIDRAERPALRRALLVASLVANLGTLALFKYFDFFVHVARGAFALAGIRLPLAPLALILPAGISFHTFQSLSYTIDVYRREVRPTRSWLHLATFVLFFPQLVAGPIVRAREFLPQLTEPRQRLARVDGLFRITLGLFKKVALADVLATTLVDRVFARPELFSGLECLLGVYGYAFQIYLDFSGYSDMAIGLARLFGIVFPANFNSPYKAASIIDFWRRWHMTLSRFLRDYLYIPLGGGRCHPLRRHANLMATMLLGG
ncbi:MAG: MBOAT family O-acyltransferase, partial [Deltaproteobacteria bacterium]